MAARRIRIKQYWRVRERPDAVPAFCFLVNRVRAEAGYVAVILIVVALSAFVSGLLLPFQMLN